MRPKAILPSAEIVEVVVWSAGRPFAEPADDGEAVRLTALGLVVGEHVDKIGFFEPSIEILGKEMERDSVSFTLRRKRDGKPLDEIVRGFKIGCFKIAREYGLIRPGGDGPIFRTGYDVRTA